MNTFCYGKSYLSEDDYVPELGLVNALNCANNFGFNLKKKHCNLGLYLFVWFNFRKSNSLLMLFNVQPTSTERNQRQSLNVFKLDTPDRHPLNRPENMNSLTWVHVSYLYIPSY